jgi:hypothetical protein
MKSVFTAPTASASGVTLSKYLSMATLCGIVTDAPINCELPVIEVSGMRTIETWMLYQVEKEVHVC